MKIDFKKTSIIYFSGTGNTAFLAQNLSEALKVKKYSIEENLNWSKLFNCLDYVVLMYPIYGSLPPLIMRDFVLKYQKALEGKQFVSIACQMMYSGDGARVIGDYLPQGEDSILYGAHVNMPNNIPNIPFVPLSKGYFRKRKVSAGQRKIQRIAMELKLGRFKRQGFNKISKHLGEYQRPGFEKIEKNQSTMVRVTEDCIGCRECVKICPCNNFEMIDKKAWPKGHCTLCFRCVNHCKAKAIRVLIHKPIKDQYRFE